jgi:vacuolar-type H+-ATPase subunit I/STV1
MNEIKQMNLAETIGIVLIVIGFIFMILDGRIENELFLSILKKYQLLYWSGLAIWAVGHMKKETIKKQQREE